LALKTLQYHVLKPFGPCAYLQPGGVPCEGAEFINRVHRGG